MRIYFTTIVRGMSLEKSGELVCLDWETKTVLHRTYIFPKDPSFKDPNSRGNSRGGRGIALLPDGRILTASYHSLHIFSPDLKNNKQISGFLLAGVHEIFLSERNTLWVASTGVDAALEMDYHTGNIISQYWPREMAGIQKALNLIPLDIDKLADNRIRFIDEKFTKHPSHIHLNTVTEWKGDVFALLHTFGAVVNLSQDKVVFRSQNLKGSHNLIFLDNNLAIINNTNKRTIQFYDFRQKKLIREIIITDFPEVNQLVSYSQRMNYYFRGVRNRLGLKYLPNPLPFFVRGLELVGKSLFVGTSPASILKIDLETGKLMDFFPYSQDISVCIHGISFRSG